MSFKHTYSEVLFTLPLIQHPWLAFLNKTEMYCNFGFSLGLIIVENCNSRKYGRRKRLHFRGTDVLLWRLRLFGMKKYSWHLNFTEWINEITLNEPLLKKTSVNQGPKNCASRNLELPNQANKSRLMQIAFTLSWSQHCSSTSDFNVFAGTPAESSLSRRLRGQNIDFSEADWCLFVSEMIVLWIIALSSLWIKL